MNKRAITALALLSAWALNFANALVIWQAVYLVDAGDGAVQQLLPAARAVFISRIDIDHPGARLAVLRLRHQMD